MMAGLIALATGSLPAVHAQEAQGDSLGVQATILDAALGVAVAKGFRVSSPENIMAVKYALQQGSVWEDLESIPGWADSPSPWQVCRATEMGGRVERTLMPEGEPTDPFIRSSQQVRRAGCGLFAAGVG